MEFQVPTAVAADLYEVGCSWPFMADATAGIGIGNYAPEVASSGNGDSGGKQHVCAGVPPGAEKRTRPMCLAYSALTTKRGRLGDMRVTFAPDAKPHDGLSMKALRFEEFIRKDVCSATPRETTAAVACATAGDMGGLHALRSQLEDLVVRCAALPVGASTPILSAGGGRADCVTIAHLPFLQKHLGKLNGLVDNLGGGGATSE